MWLINIKTRELEAFIEGSIPPYAILSHRWTKEELNFKDVLKKRANKHSKGYKKLVKACEVAALYDVKYLWIDTCCIDKRSSAELSEAINSMFAWYYDSKVCLAYLEDVSAGPEFETSFRSSVWFTRSWTLQELLAPYNVKFYDGGWTFFGDRKSHAAAIEEITAIDRLVLTGQRELKWCSNAARMSWAANRTATRSEDIAYSLMGIFGVNMALLYGEGPRAFSRLQEEIIRHTQDTTFLLWGYSGSTRLENRLLARSPADFQGLEAGTLSRWNIRPLLGITNVGLEIEARVCRMGQDLYGLVLARDTRHQYAVLVRKLTTSTAFVKLGVSAIPSEGESWSEVRKMVVEWDADRRADSGSPLLFDKEPLILSLTVNASEQSQICVKRIFYTSYLDLRDDIPPPHRNTHIIKFDNPANIEVAEVICQISKTSALAIYVSFDFDCCPCALVCNGSDEPAASAIYSYIQKAHLQRQSEEEQYSMMNNLKRRFGCDMYFFRGRPRETTTARVPAEVISNDYTVYFGFIPPPTHGYSPYGLLGSWKFYISDHLS